MRKIKFLLFLALLSCVSFASIAEDRDKKILNKSNYYPLVVGSEWKYDTNRGEMKIKIIAGEEKNTVVSVWEVSGVTSKEYFFETDKGIMCTGREMYILFLGDSYKYSPALPRFSFPLYPGKKWKWKGKKHKSENEVINAELQAEVYKKEKVSVTAGSFDCIKVRINISDDEKSKEDFNQWLAPGVGMVKGEGVIAGSGILGFLSKLFGGGRILMELKSYKLAGEESKKNSAVND